MTLPRRLKCLIFLLNFAVLVYTETNTRRSKHLDDCCDFGKTISRISCREFSYNFDEIPPRLRATCRARITTCCMYNVEVDDCERGKEAAYNENVNTCSHSRRKFEICCKACKAGNVTATKGNDCYRPVHEEDPLALKARISCCEKMRNELLIVDDNNISDEETDYEDQDEFFENTIKPFSSTRKPTSLFNDLRSQTRHFRPTTTQLPYEIITGPFNFDPVDRKPSTNHFRSQNNNFGIFTTRRKPPHYRHHFQSTPVYLASRANQRNDREPCGDSSYCEHSCIIMGREQKCSCNDGYELNRDGRSCRIKSGLTLPPEEMRQAKECKWGEFRNDLGICEDINECEIENNGCGERAKCRNLIGKGYECIPMDICRTGFRYDSAVRVCRETEDNYQYLTQRSCSSRPAITAYNTTTRPPPRSTSWIPRTTTTASPAPTTTRYKDWMAPEPVTWLPSTTKRPHGCSRGFELSLFGDCVDINECDHSRISPCSPGYVCLNNIGSYRCIKFCPQGSQHDGTRCVPVNPCDSNPCPLTHNCINYDGRHYCKTKSCSSGYKVNSTGVCVDINECDSAKSICMNGVCVNKPGSFECRCNDGFKQDGDKLCQDIDECAEDVHGCEHQCRNTFGGFYCVCDKGYEKNRDNNRTCEDIDECLESGSTACIGDCVNTIGGYECRCPSGFIENNELCEDINECQDGTNPCDEISEECLNVPGSFKCVDMTCKDDYKFVVKDDLRQCKLEKACGFDNDDPIDCNMPWMYRHKPISIVQSSRFNLTMNLCPQNDTKLEAVFSNFVAFPGNDRVRLARIEDFSLTSNSSGVFISSNVPVDGPQAIELDLLLTWHGPENKLENKSEEKFKIFVSEFGFKFPNRKNFVWRKK